MKKTAIFFILTCCLILAALPVCSFAEPLQGDEFVVDPFAGFEPENPGDYGFDEDIDDEAWSDSWGDEWDEEWDEEEGGWTEYWTDSEWNMVVNPGFEELDATGWAAGWTTGSLAQEVTEFSIAPEGFMGGSAAKLTSRSANVAYFEQIIPVAPDTLYRASCYIRAQNVPDGGLGAHMTFMDSDTMSDDFHNTDGEWGYAEIYLDVGHDVYEVTLQLRLGGDSSLTAGTAYFDDIEFEIADGLPDGVLYAQVGEVYDHFDEDEGSGDGGIPHSTTIVFATLLCAALMYLCYRASNRRTELFDKDDMRAGGWLKGILIAGIAVRVIASFVFKGHPTDINCFTYWADSAFKLGPMNFYTSGFFSDYPPGYIAVLYFVGFVKSVLGIETGSALFSALVRVPAIAADMVSVWLIYKMAKPRGGNTFALSLAAAAAFSLTFIFVSSGWGQIDSILTLLALLCIERFTQGRLYSASSLFAAAVLIKPQGLMFGPLFLVAFIARMMDMQDKRKALKELGLCLLTMLAVFAAVIIPFTGKQEPLWFMEKYVGTATQYDYASVNAFNLFGIVGANWTKADEPFIFGISYQALGSVLLIAVLAYCCFMYLRSRKKEGSLLLTSAVMIAGIFMFSHFMHERYIFPSLLLLLAAYCKIGDKRLMYSFIAISAATLFNAGFIYSVAADVPMQVADAFQPIIILGGLAQLISVVYLGYSAHDILLRGAVLPPKAEIEPKERREYEPLTLEPRDNKLRMTKRDYLFVTALTLVYAVIALLNLASLQAPGSYWRAGDGKEAVAEFGSNKYVREMRVFAGIGTGEADVVLHKDGGETDAVITYKQTYDEMYRWQVIPVDQDMSGVTVRPNGSDLWIYEIAFFDSEGKRIDIVSSAALVGAQAGDPVTDPLSAANHLFDEPDMVPDTPSYLNGMYFDELYHARTAFEHLRGLNPYENSHPPLGKIFIMLGVAVFGMNAFGWRIVGTLFGIAMVPVMYLFAKRLFKKPELALFAAGMFTFDFMHFVQTRIATIDTYGVFFIMLMYYYMYQYYTMSFYTDGLKKTLRPLALCGLFFALGCASKWICIYAGIGLAALFAASLFSRWREHNRARIEYEAQPEKLGPYEVFKKNTIRTILFAVVFFVIVPVAVYLASYLPYFLSVENPYDLKGVWGVQEFMFSYHSNLTETHPFQSSWWSWPLVIRPIWYYAGSVGPGMVSSISSFGNPIVWLSALAGVAALIIARVRGTVKPSAVTAIILVGIASQFLPWVPISRATFIYHYFASVPFIILALTFMIERFERTGGRRPYLKWVLLGLAVVVFALFYPLLSGLTVSRSYAELLKWLPSWTLF